MLRVDRRGRPLAALVAVLAALAVFASGCSGGSTTHTHRSPPAAGDATGGPAATAGATGEPRLASDPTASLKFVDCTSRIEHALAGEKLPKASDFTYGCGEMAVPLDWAKPDSSSKVNILVVRIRSVHQHDRIGSLVINPGGPGAPGTDAALGLALTELPDDILDRFDIIGFDPRGTGGSGPIQCTSDARQDAEAMLPADPSTTAQFQLIIDAAKQDAKTCDTKYGKTLTYYSTLETARDMEALRGALGDNKLTYLGYSYGSYLGAVYATLFPARVRALVLDGAMDPNLDDAKLVEDQVAGFVHAFNDLAAACKAEGSRCPIGPNARASVVKVIAKAKANPIPTSKPGDDRKASAREVVTAVVSAMYAKADWPTLEQAIAQAEGGDSKGVLALRDSYEERDASGHYSSLDDANSVISCADGGVSRSLDYVRQKEKEWNAKWPIFGGSGALGLLGCAGSGITPDAHVTIHAPSAPPILVVGTKNDPATPYEWTSELASALGTGEVLTWDGEGHTAYPQTTCVNNAVGNYLINLKLPPKGTVCPAGPLLYAGS